MGNGMSNTPGIVNPGEIILYRTDDGRTQIQMRAVDGTVWLTQAEMADLFDTGVPNVNKHITAVLDEGEVSDRTISSQEIVRQEGGRSVHRTIQIYNLDMILAIGYRVRSPRGTQFRQWATTTLREYLVKGFVMNDERLKAPGAVDYFDELLERIREIRASEKRFYQKVKDVFATSADYDSKLPVAKTFFATIQNKLVYAVTGRTAAELIVARCDPDKPRMGLTSWAGARVRKADVTVSKNYLADEELQELNRLTNMYLDMAEDRAKRRQQMTMSQWVDQTNRFLQFNEREVLVGAGSVSHTKMAEIAEGRYARFDAVRRHAEQVEAARDDLAELERLEQEARRGLGPGLS